MTASFSLSFWLKGVNIIATHNIFGLYDLNGGVSNGFYGSLTNTSELQANYKADDNLATVSSNQGLVSDFTDGFHHVVISVDSAGFMELFMDGTIVTTFVGASDGDMTGVTMGNYSLTAGSKFAFGCVRWYGTNLNHAYVTFDEIRLYDIALTAAQAFALYVNDA
jgi:hypothetical protein